VPESSSAQPTVLLLVRSRRGKIGPVSHQQVRRKMKTTIWIVVFIAVFISGARCDQFTTVQFPSVAGRIDFFEPRINSADPGVRRRALTEIMYFDYHASEEVVGFLRRMCMDSDAGVRGDAVRHLYERFVKVNIESLPQPIAWYGSDGGDYSNPKFKNSLLDHLRNGGTSGAIATQIGYLGLTEAAPLLREAVKHLNDTMTQTEIARALLECGDTASAIALWRQVIAVCREHYENKHDSKPNDEYYYVQACWGLTHISETRFEGLSALATAMSDFEHAATPNSQNKLVFAQKLFASATGTWCSTGTEAHNILKTLQANDEAKPSPLKK
jgi:hypothetical protein